MGWFMLTLALLLVFAVASEDDIVERSPPEPPLEPAQTETIKPEEVEHDPPVAARRFSPAGFKSEAWTFMMEEHTSFQPNLGGRGLQFVHYEFPVIKDASGTKISLYVAADRVRDEEMKQLLTAGFLIDLAEFVSLPAYVILSVVPLLAGLAAGLVAVGTVGAILTGSLSLFIAIPVLIGAVLLASAVVLGSAAIGVTEWLVAWWFRAARKRGAARMVNKHNAAVAAAQRISLDAEDEAYHPNVGNGVW